jgi:hypothetical protein
MLLVSEDESKKGLPTEFKTLLQQNFKCRKNQGDLGVTECSSLPFAEQIFSVNLAVN